MHGKSSRIVQCSGKLFDGIKPGFKVGRYHSLIAKEIPDCLKVSAFSDDDVVMAIEHERLPVAAVQFHPESILSLEDNIGERIIENVVEYVLKN